jgi:carbamoyltransferase
MIDGRIEVAIMEERLSRKKHHEGFPDLAIDYCMKSAGIADINEVDYFVINQYNKSACEMELVQYRNYSNRVIINPSHHLLHAYYAYFASGFEDAAVLIVDGSGYNYGEYVVRNSPHLGPAPEFSEMEEADAIYFVRNGNIELIEKRWGLWHSSEPYYRFPSLGHMFSAASQYIFGSWQHAGKTMGLAPYGDSNALQFQIVTKTANGLAVDVDWILDFPKPVRGLSVEEVKINCDIAAKVQAELEEAMVYMAKRAYDATQSPNLCLSGGVALNSVANGRIILESPFQNVFITPAANDGGIAIGAALYGFHHLNKRPPVFKHVNDFYGRAYEDSEILEAIQNNPRLQYERVDNPAQRAAADLADRKIIGWFEGKSELGPRALGHRSILCDPRLPGMKDALNSKVKYRESFRPYAASVLEEHTAEYFDIHSRNPYMLVVTSILPDKRSTLPAVCHIDGTCRIQTVGPDYDGNYRKLIEYFYELTSVPMVLNTSFNIRGEPIVESPQDALACFLGSGIDFLYIGSYRISKFTVSESGNLDYSLDLIPYLNDDLTLIKESGSDKGRSRQDRLLVRMRTGHHMLLEAPLFKLLEAVDGRSTGNMLLQTINREMKDPWSAEQMRLHLQALQKIGVISFVRPDLSTQPDNE